MAIGILAGAVVGFITAWQLKPAVGNPESAADSPLRTRVERRPTTPHPLGKPAPSAFSLRWEELGNDDDCEEKREALLANLGPAEFPALLAEMADNAGLSGLGNSEDDQLSQLFIAWFGKAPDDALVWMRQLHKASDRQRLLCEIVNHIAETDTDRAISLLRQYGADDEGHIFIPRKLLEKTAAQGADKLLEVCRFGLNRGGDWPCPCEISIPQGFEFRKVLDGLAAAQLEIGDDGRFASVPCNLVTEWAKRDFKSAWAWLMEGKSVVYNGTSDLIRSVPPAEAGALLGEVFDHATKDKNPYADAASALYSCPSSEMLEAFLKTASGDRSANLNGLFDALRGGNLGELQSLLLERMRPEQRADALRRNFKEGTDSQTKSALARLLRGLGHSDEEIQSLLPERKD